MIYNILKTILYTAVHPIKSINKLAKMIVKLAHALTLPETWSQFGIGMVGGSLGMAATGNPLSLIGLAIGGALTLGGVTASTIKAIVNTSDADKHLTIKNHLVAQLEQLAESGLTGFCMGAIIGSIRKAINAGKNNFKARRLAQAQHEADKFIQQNNLPKYSNVSFDHEGNVTLYWESESTCKSFLSSDLGIQNDKGIYMPFLKSKTNDMVISLKLTGRNAEWLHFKSYYHFDHPTYHQYVKLPKTSLSVPQSIHPLQPYEFSDHYTRLKGGFKLSNPNAVELLGPTIVSLKG